MRISTNLFIIIFALLTFSSSAITAFAEEKIPGIGPVGEVKKLHGDFKFTEGPAYINGELYFTDIPNLRVHKIDAEGKLSTFKENSERTNGLMRHKDEIYACQMAAGRIVAWSFDGSKERVVVDKFEGKRLNAPNDLVIDKSGGVYFADPMFSAPKPLPQEKTCVYYVDASAKISRLIDDLPNPNGVILSPDETRLYVIPSGQSDMMVYDVKSPGVVENGKVFCTLKQPEGKKNTGGDGLAVDTKGNLYITSQLHIQVFSPEGKALGIIKFPEQPANVDFGGKDNKTLYATAKTSVYAVEMEATGHQFGGK